MWISLLKLMRLPSARLRLTTAQACLDGRNSRPSRYPDSVAAPKKRPTEYDRADVVVGIRFHKHKRLTKAAWRRVDPYRILSAGLYRESKLIGLFS